MNRGLFVSLEGIDGCGKTSVLEILLKKLHDFKPRVIREPGGTVISEKIRDLLLDTQNESMLARTEAFLYAAARAQVVEEVIKPALEAGKMVIADRFMDSTLAYQGYGRGLDLKFLHELNQLCTEGIVPDLTVVLDIDPKIGALRRKQDTPDRLEKEGIEFQSRVRDGYMQLAAMDSQRIKVVNSDQELELVVEEVRNHIMGWIKTKGVLSE